MLRDEKGGLMHAGRYWDPEERKHTSGTGPGDRAYSAVPVDLDADGDLDLLVGTDKGRLFVRENVGTAKAPAFATSLSELPKAGKTPWFSEGYAMPVVVDWDGDGRFDLVSGGKEGGVAWLRNVGKDGEPAFETERWILEPKETSEAGLGERTQIEVADYDGDGDLDLLVGDHSYVGSGTSRTYRGNVWLYRRQGAPTSEHEGR